MGRLLKLNLQHTWGRLEELFLPFFFSKHQCFWCGNAQGKYRTYRSHLVSLKPTVRQDKLHCMTETRLIFNKLHILLFLWLGGFSAIAWKEGKSYLWKNHNKCSLGQKTNGQPGLTHCTERVHESPGEGESTPEHPLDAFSSSYSCTCLLIWSWGC